MNGFHQVFKKLPAASRSANTRPAGPVPAVPMPMAQPAQKQPEFNPWFHDAEAWERGVGIRKAQTDAEQANGINALLAGGDLEGARSKAMGYGNFEAVKQVDDLIAGMDKRTQAEMARKAEISAAVLQPLLDLDETEREQYRDRVIQSLKAGGFTEQELAQLDFSTIGIQQDINVALGLKSRMEGRDFTEMGDDLVLSDKVTGTAGSIYQRSPTYAEETDRIEAKKPGGSGGGAGELGLTPIYARNNQTGERIALQPSKSGGLIPAQIPEGFTLEDPRFVEAGKTQGRELAKQQVYQTTAGQAVLAAEQDFNRLSAQIDTAITQSTKKNTGFIRGRMPSVDLEATLETITGSTAFTNLVNLKAQGGTLGALSDSELQLLATMIANVKRSQNEAQLDANLRLLKDQMRFSMQRIKDKYEQEYAAGRFAGLPQIGGGAGGGVSTAPETPNASELSRDELIRKYLD